MSRNFDLMREMEMEQAFHYDRTIESAFPTPGEHRNGTAHHQLTSDATQRLVQQIFLQKTQESPRMVVFAGINHGDGCSEMAASVAECLASSAPKAVCLVEANFRSPGLPAMLGTTNYRGLTNALMEEGPLRSFIKPAYNESLWLLSSGPLSASSSNLLSSEAMKRLSAEMRKEFDFVIVDAPPLTRYADAIALGHLSDGMVLVIEANSTRREAALLAVENLRSGRIPILGAVLNKRTFPIPEKVYSRL
jgi:capsular exopolysaccharide synthesis family protein